MNVQEGRLEQAQDALRQIRAAGSRRSKEARLVTCFQMLTKLAFNSESNHSHANSQFRLPSWFQVRKSSLHLSKPQYGRSPVLAKDAS